MLEDRSIEEQLSNENNTMTNLQEKTAQSMTSPWDTEEAHLKSKIQTLSHDLEQRERFTQQLLAQTLAQDEEIRKLKSDAKIRDERLTALHNENIRLKEQISAQYQQNGDRNIMGLRRMSKFSFTMQKLSE